MSNPSPPAVAALEASTGCILETAAQRGEWLVAWCRLGFCSLVLSRFLTLNTLPAARSFNMAVLGVGIVFSLGMLRHLRRRQFGIRLLALSVTFDVLVCGLSLLQSILWQAGPYRGLLTELDPAAMLLMVVAGGVRVYPSVALLGGGLSLVVCGGLIALDVRTHPALGYGWPSIALFLMYLLGTTALAVVIARRTLSLVRTAARDELRVEQARSDYLHLMRDQHDARSLLCAAALHADLVQRALDHTPSPDRAPPVELLHRLREDLSRAGALVSDLGEQAWKRAADLRGARPVDLASVLARALPALRRAHPGLQLVCPLDANQVLPPVELPGGAASVERILANLVRNAVEGDGTRGATTVGLVARVAGTRVVLEVTDDGPGFPPGLLGDRRPPCFSTKPSGSGLGLHGISQLLEHAGGRLLCRNQPGGGALVTVELPRGTASST